MVNDTLQNTTRALHDVGLASWLGGSMFGKFALNPAVAGVSDKSERGKVANLAWNGYNVINSLGLGTAAAGYLAARQTELSGKRLTDLERNLYRVQDGLMATAVVTGIANGIQGARLAKQGPDGAVPIETGTKPAPETPPAAARIQRSLGVLGNVNILTGIALVALNGMQSRAALSRPPIRRALLRRSTP
jgi:uncharacterized membrane protein